MNRSPARQERGFLCRYVDTRLRWIATSVSVAGSLSVELAEKGTGYELDNRPCRITTVGSYRRFVHPSRPLLNPIPIHIVG